MDVSNVTLTNFNGFEKHTRVVNDIEFDNVYVCKITFFNGVYMIKNGEKSYAEHGDYIVYDPVANERYFIDEDEYKMRYVTFRHCYNCDNVAGIDFLNESKVFVGIKSDGGIVVDSIADDGVTTIAGSWFSIGMPKELAIMLYRSMCDVLGEKNK